jgi:hypothetical protein
VAGEVESRSDRVRASADALTPTLSRKRYGIHTLKVGGAHRLPPSAREARGGPTRAKPERGGGRFPEALRRRSGAGVDGCPGPTAASSSSPAHLAQPPPTPTPPRHSASPSGGREKREADMCESDSPQAGGGTRVPTAGENRGGSHAGIGLRTAPPRLPRGAGCKAEGRARPIRTRLAAPREGELPSRSRAHQATARSSPEGSSGPAARAGRPSRRRAIHGRRQRQREQSGIKSSEARRSHPSLCAQWVSRTMNGHGVKTHTAEYECPGGQTFKRQGFGHNPPGLVRDPFE